MERPKVGAILVEGFSKTDPLYEGLVLKCISTTLPEFYKVGDVVYVKKFKKLKDYRLVILQNEHRHPNNGFNAVWEVIDDLQNKLEWE